MNHTEDHPDGSCGSVDCCLGPDQAVIDCPVKCEGCGVVLPMEAAFTTEDPVYLCANCAVGAVLSDLGKG